MARRDLQDMTPHNLDGDGAFYFFIHQTIEIIYLGRTPEETPPGLPGSSFYEPTDLRRILETMDGDTQASPKLRKAAAESLQALP
jgi:hypothetical protein